MEPNYSIRATRRLELTPEEVHHLITHPRTWPDWQSEIDSTSGPEALATGDTVEGRARMLGFKVNGHADMDEVKDLSVSHQVIVGVRMRVRYDLEPDGTGVIVTHTLTADMPDGLAGKLLSVFLRRRLKKMQRKLLDNLTQRRPSG